MQKIPKYNAAKMKKSIILENLKKPHTVIACHSKKYGSRNKPGGLYDVGIFSDRRRKSQNNSKSYECKPLRQIVFVCKFRKK